MKNKLRYIGPAMIALLALTSGALAQTQGGELPPKAIGHALLNSIIFASVGMLAVFVAFKVFDKATPRVDIQKELLNNNIAVAILTGAVIIGISIIVAASIM